MQPLYGDPIGSLLILSEKPMHIAYVATARSYIRYGNPFDDIIHIRSYIE
jgi:hypothetical protein